MLWHESDIKGSLLVTQPNQEDSKRPVCFLYLFPSYAGYRRGRAVVLSTEWSSSSLMAIACSRRSDSRAREKNSWRKKYGGSFPPPPTPLVFTLYNLRPPSSGCHTLLSERLELAWEAQTYWERSDDQKYVCASQASLEQAMMAFMGRPSPSEGDSDKEINCKNRGRRFCWLSTLGL